MIWKNWDRLDAGTIRERQGAELHKYLKNQVLKYSPFYREMFKREGLSADDIRSLDDLHKIPFTTKADVVPSSDKPGKPREFVLQPNPDTFASTLSTGKKLGMVKNRFIAGREMKDQVLDEYLPVFFIATTGRTAVPTPFLYSKEDMVIFREAARRLMVVSLADRQTDFVMNLFPYAPHLAFWIVYNAGIENGLPIFHTGGGKILGSERIIAMIESYRATLLVGIPGYLYHLLRIAAEQGRDYSNVKKIVLGAERVTPGYKRRIKELLESMGAKDPVILSTYGFTEARSAWMECPCEDTTKDTTGYHLYPDMHIFEIIDPETGKEVGDGETGEVVITSLGWRGSVVLRYRTGDMARGGITRKQCPVCGRTVPRLSTDITRVSEVNELNLSKVRGTLVDFNEFFPIMHDIPEIVEWQIEITRKDNDPHELDEIHAYLNIRDDADGTRVSRSLNQAVRETMELSLAEIKYESIQSITDRLGMEDRVKEIRIVDRRKEL